MENRTTSRLVLVFALMFSSALFGAERIKADPYAEAVATYVEAAGVQLQAIRESVNASTKEATEDVKQRYADVTQRLDRCDDFVKRLKVAPPREFDFVKAEFEKARAEVVKSLEAARKTL